MKELIEWFQVIGHELKEWVSFMTIAEWITLAIIIVALALAMTGTSATQKVVRRKRKRWAQRRHASDADDEQPISDVTPSVLADEDVVLPIESSNRSTMQVSGEVKPREDSETILSDLSQDLETTKGDQAPSEQQALIEASVPLAPADHQVESASPTLLDEAPIDSAPTSERSQTKGDKTDTAMHRMVKSSLNVSYGEPNSDKGRSRQRDDMASLTGGGDTVAAQLNLARVYADIGDTKEAKQLLDEVLKVGDPQQKALAQAVINRLPDA